MEKVPLTKMKRVAVIGAGCSGIMALKILSEESDRFDLVCYEATDNYGGTWRYREEDIEGVASIMSTTVINHSKELGSISDFPPPAHYPNYMSHHLLFEYWSNFAKVNGCLKHIRYNHEVMKVVKAPDYDSTGRWTVQVKNKASNEIFSDVYDAVFVCVGHSTHPNIPKFKGGEQFRGKMFHTHSLKTVDAYRNQRVAVIGIGCSGLDASVEMSSVAKEVYVSTRRGAWILPRLGPFGLPFDYTLLRRSLCLSLCYLPIGLVSYCLQCLALTCKFSHGLYGIKPKHGVLSQDPAISDTFPYKLLTGSIRIKGDIKTFTENGIVFDGDAEETPLDTVVLATGYQWKFPFLADDIVSMTGDRINLYKCIFPAQLSHPTLAIIGFVQPLGPGFPFGELQCRWATQLLLGNVKLPDEKAMSADVEAHHRRNANRYPRSDRLTIHVDYISYLDEIASQIGAKPNLFKMALTDPELFWHLLAGPSVPYQYRLQGPHPWPKAREAILTSKDRMKTPLQKGKPVSFGKGKTVNSTFYVSLVVIVWTVAVVLFGML